MSPTFELEASAMPRISSLKGYGKYSSILLAIVSTILMTEGGKFHTFLLV